MIFSTHFNLKNLVMLYTQYVWLISIGVCGPDARTHAICSILCVSHPLYLSKTDCYNIYTNQIEMKIRSFLDYWIDKVLHISYTFCEIEYFQQCSQQQKALLYVRQHRIYQKFTIVAPSYSQAVFNHISKWELDSLLLFFFLVCVRAISRLFLRSSQLPQWRIVCLHAK